MHVFRRVVFVGVALLVFRLTRPASAASPGQNEGPPSNDTCLACHASPSLSATLILGETLSLHVDPEGFAASVHGTAGLACVQCHTDITGYPHPPFSAATRREVTLKLYTACKQCHAENFEKALDSVHGRELAAGNTNAAVCTDCHGAHDIQPPDQPRTRIPETCAKCHNEIYETYKTSVHGAALTVGNPDVPSCIDCHSVHNIQEASTGVFRLRSPDICAKCHTDEALMAKYGVRTDVLTTYLSDFHGTTVTLFEKEAPGQQTNKPVCIDCHGVHDIKLTTDPNSRVIQRNLLATCQKCHPDATENYPAAWLSHYSPDAQHNSLVYFVNLFYKFFIPTVLGGMALFVVSDIGRRWAPRLGRYIPRRRAKASPPPQAEEGDPSQQEDDASPPAQVEAGGPPQPEENSSPPPQRDDDGLPPQEKTGGPPQREEDDSQVVAGGQS